MIVHQDFLSSDTVEVFSKNFTLLPNIYIINNFLKSKPRPSRLIVKFYPKDCYVYRENYRNVCIKTLTPNLFVWRSIQYQAPRFPIFLLHREGKEASTWIWLGISAEIWNNQLTHNSGSFFVPNIGPYRRLYSSYRPAVYYINRESLQIPLIPLLPIKRWTVFRHC